MLHGRRTTTTTLRYFHPRTGALAWRGCPGFRRCRGCRVCTYVLIVVMCLCLSCFLLVVVVVALSPTYPAIGVENPQSLPAYHRLLVEEEVVPTLAAAAFQHPHMHPACSLFPETSVTSIWNHIRIRHGPSSSSLSSLASPSEVDVPLSDLRRGIRTRPRISHWTHLLDKLALANLHPKKYLKVVLLVPPLVDTQLEDPQQQQQQRQKQRILTSRMQEILNQRVEHWSFRWGVQEGWQDKWNFRMVQVHHDQLQDDFKQKRVLAALADSDIVIDATGASPPPSLVRSDTTTTTAMTPDYQNQLRAQKQPWIRRFLVSSKKRAQKIPSLILLDGLLPADLGAWNAMAVTRGLQELADWYQIPFISVTSIVQPIKYQQRYASLLQTYKERSNLVDDEGGDDDDERHSMASMLLQFEFTVDLIALAFLDFTIDHCQSQSMPIDATTTSPPPLPILKQGVELMAEYVVPPALDPSLSLQHVSKKWKQVLEQKQNKKWKPPH